MIEQTTEYVIFIGKINSSQDGVIVSLRGCAPCLTSGHGNCPKIIFEEDERGNRDREYSQDGQLE